MMFRRSTAGAALLSLAITSATLAAHAQQQSNELSRSERDELARVHFRAGSRYFDMHRYAEAAAEFERVFELSGQNGLLFNAGRAWEAAGQARSALRAYERFLQGDLGGVDRARVQASINALTERVRAEEQAAQQRAAAGCPEPAATAVTPPTNSSGTANTAATAAASTGPLLQLQTRVTYTHRTLDATAPWVLLGVGGVFAGLTAWQAIAYARDASAVTAARQWSADLAIAQGNAYEESRNAILAGSTAGVFLVTGGLWLALRGRGEPHEEVLRTAWVAPTGNGVMVGGRF